MLPSCMYGAVSAMLLETEIVLSVRSENRQKLKAVRSSNRLLHAGPIFLTLLIQCGTDGKADRIHVQALPDGRERTWGERSEFLAVAGEVLGLERHPGHFGPAHKVWTTPSIHSALRMPGRRATRNRQTTEAALAPWPCSTYATGLSLKSMSRRGNQ